MKRRFLVAGVIASLFAGALAGVAYTGDKDNQSGVRKGEGAGMYSDPSTANLASTFTINKLMVSCGVASENLAGGGPFEMLMFSTDIRRYKTDKKSQEITATGEMRSITRSGGAVVEDVRHAFIAHALDGDGDEGQPRTDRFDVHLRTNFWQPGNPMCTPSTRYPGLCRFGGRLFAGNINVQGDTG